MIENKQHRLAGAIGGLIVGGFLGALAIALALSFTSRPLHIRNIIPLSLACAICSGIAGYSIKGIGKVFVRILDII